MNITVVGSGYVGLVSGVCLAARGHDVTCVDIDRDIVNDLNAGRPHIYEPHLKELLQNVLKAQRFRASHNLALSLAGSEMLMVAVGTPSLNGRIDLTHVRRVAREVGLLLRERNDFLSVIVKSTVIPGTTDTLVAEEITSTSSKSKESFGLGMNPEFLREGEAVHDFMEPDRIVLGFDDQLSLNAMREIYRDWSCDKLEVNTRTAELIKYANNVLLATQISAINEIANFAGTLGGIDIMSVVQGVHLDRRWSPFACGERVHPPILTYLIPGCGFGGSCFRKDIEALRSEGRRRGLPMALLNAVLEVNEAQPLQVCDLIAREMALSGKAALLLGLAFKPNTDDVRESPSFTIVQDLLSRGVKVTVHDPMAATNFLRSAGEQSRDICVVDDWRGAVESADIIVVVTQWPEYRDLANLGLRGQMIFDCRQMFKPHELTNAHYLSVGRSPSRLLG